MHSNKFPERGLQIVGVLGLFFFFFFFFLLTSLSTLGRLLVGRTNACEIRQT